VSHTLILLSGLPFLYLTALQYQIKMICNEKENLTHTRAPIGKFFL
jgi:hypothetical protein